MALIASCIVAAAIVFGVACAVALRPWLSRWGATSDERAKALPGDARVPEANSSAIRALTIQAPPERVWPWIAQTGQGRGAFYSYAWLENLFGCRIVNAGKIHAEWQDVKAGDGIRFHPKMPALPVAIAEQARALVLGGEAIPEHHIPQVSWTIHPRTCAEEQYATARTLEIVPPNTLYDLVFNKYLLEPIHFTMERKLMLGIRDRAERLQG